MGGGGLRGTRLPGRGDKNLLTSYGASVPGMRVWLKSHSTGAI